MIHLVQWAQQPDIQILCTGEYSTPHHEDTGTPGVHRERKGLLYTFDESLVTCPDCKEKAST